MSKKMWLRKIWERKDCYGWAWHLKGKRYAYQNSNDLGLLGQDWEGIEEYGVKETILHKVKISKGKYLYILRNISGYTDYDLETSATITTIKALLKQCHKDDLTKHEQMLCDRYWKEVIQ